MSVKKKVVSILILVSAIFLQGVFFSVYYAYAIEVTAYGTPEIYKVTLHKVELYNSVTDSWVTVCEDDLTFNIASVNAGEIVGGYVNSKPIPEGTYTQERITVSRTMSIKSTTTIGITNYYTTATSISGPNGTQAVVASTNASQYTEGTVKTPSVSQGPRYTVTGEYFTDTHNLPSSIVVKKGILKKVRIKFNVTNAVEFNASWGPQVICYPLVPTVTVEIID